MGTLSETIRPAIGDYLVPDGWRGLGGLLIEGDKPVDEHYHGSEFRLPGTLGTYPVNLKVTGRSINYNVRSKPAVRVRIEWVHDCEPNGYSRGWLVLHSMGK